MEKMLLLIVGISETLGGRKHDITAPIERVTLDETVHKTVED